MEKRRIGVVTGSRAEFGLLLWLLREIQQDPLLELQLLVTGSHLVPAFGHDHLVAEEGLPVAAQVDLVLASNTPVGVAKSIGLGVIGFGEALDRLRPHILVLLGDRHELLAAASAALALAIPMAHIHGGESSEGMMDDLVRHALTKMSHLHFVAAEPYRQRVIRMGEEPARVFNVGAPGLEHLHRTPLLDRQAWQQATGFALGEVNLLVTCHPVTGDDEARTRARVAALLTALDHLADSRVIFTGSNADAGGRLISGLLADYAARHHPRTVFFANLGTVRYLSLLYLVDVVVGNSSSGIIEAPAAGAAVVNLGSRQQGRLRAPGVLDCEEEPAAMVRTIHQALSPSFQALARQAQTPYGQGDASRRMVAILRTFPLAALRSKSFYMGAY